VKEEPRVLRAGDCALVQMVPEVEVCVETFEECAPLGCFEVRESGYIWKGLFRVWRCIGRGYLAKIGNSPYFPDKAFHTRGVIDRFQGV